MNLKRNKMWNITSYIISITFYLILSLIMYNLIIKLHYYYLFVTIPMLFLFMSLGLTNIIKLFLTIISMVFGRNDNNEVLEYIDNQINSINRLCKYTLTAIFITLLSSLMILDIIYCISKEQYTFIAISIVIWILLYYLLFSNIIKRIKEEINF